MVYDYIVLGQGIAGTFMSYQLIKRGWKVLVVDRPDSNIIDNRSHQAASSSASRIASGVINPVTGRRVVQTWQIDTLLPFAKDAYAELSSFLKVQNVCKTLDVLGIHASEQMQQAFTKRIASGESAYVHPVTQQQDWERYFQIEYGMAAVRPALLIDMQILLSDYRNYLQKSNQLLEMDFDWEQLTSGSSAINYASGMLEAKGLICCEGTGVRNNPYFSSLDFRYNKGEALLVRIPDLPREHIYKLKYSLVPWGGDDLFWVGSTYEWEFKDVDPSDAFREQAEAALNKSLKLPFQVVDALASLRPANAERRPFVGWHPQYPSIGLLNGLGSKGCSLSPYYGSSFAESITNGLPLDREVNVTRCF